MIEDSYADMHIHTCFSDGTQTPEEVANAAKIQGITLLSVCDHNNIGAYARLRPACESLDITVIQGVELCVKWDGRELHLLAYNFDPTDKDMLDLINSGQSEFDRINSLIIKNITKDYPQVSFEEYELYEKPAGRGGWKSISYLYDLGITNDLLGEWRNFVKRYGDSFVFDNIANACKIIRAAGGVPVLAHPGIYWQEEELLDKLSETLLEGLGGLECHYPVHNESFTAKCVDFCKAHNLCITAGCDGHGDFAQNARGVFCDIGVLKTPISCLNLKGIV